MNDELIDIGLRIRQTRFERGYSQKDLAIALDVNIMTVSRWEDGKTEIGAAKLARLCRILGVTSDHILGLHNYQSELEQLKKIREIIING